MVALHKMPPTYSARDWSYCIVSLSRDFSIIKLSKKEKIFADDYSSVRIFATAEIKDRLSAFEN